MIAHVGLAQGSLERPGLGVGAKQNRLFRPVDPVREAGIIDLFHDAAGLFAYNPAERPLPAPVNTVLSGGAISSYFRFPFEFGASPVGARAFFRPILADGAVIYLNGEEVYRYNLPPGPVNAYIGPSNSIDAPVDLGAFSLPQTKLRYGTNVFAGELHGYGSNDNSLVFGVELNARILSRARGPVLNG